MKLNQLINLANPFVLAAAPPSQNLGSCSLFGRIFGLRTVPDLGTLTTSLTASVNVPVVHRSSFLAPGLYGSRFRYWEFAKARNAFTGVITHFVTAFGFLCLILTPIGMLLKKFVFQPGQGPERNEALKHDYIEYRGIATADEDSKEEKKAKRAFGKVAFEGDMYWFTGLALAQAAMVILTNEKELVLKNSGGILTPSTLGQEYVDRLDEAGVTLETKMLED